MEDFDVNHFDDIAQGHNKIIISLLFLFHNQNIQLQNFVYIYKIFNKYIDNCNRKQINRFLCWIEWLLCVFL